MFRAFALGLRNGEILIRDSQRQVVFREAAFGLLIIKVLVPADRGSCRLHAWLLRSRFG